MGTRLYVGNLPYNASELQIREFFEAGGRKVSQIKIITDRESGRPRGFAFVELTEPQMADTAISELHGTQFGGRTIVVNHAHQPQRADGGGGSSASPGNAGNDRDAGGGRNGHGNTRGGGDAYGGRDSYGGRVDSGRDSYGGGRGGRGRL